MRRAPVSGTRLLAILLATLVVAVGFTSFDGFMGKPGGATAADLRTFDPGNIISDENFFNSTTMDAPGVQRFLDSQVSSCPTGSLCLKNFRQDTFTRAGDRYCSEYAGASRESAADIIAKVARACGINPQVILVTLQKEQGLVRASNPSRAAVDRAMGYMCPDTPQGCNPAYFGFYNQVFNAARQFKLYQFATTSNGSPYFTAYAPGGWRDVRFSPTASCGSSRVFIQNQATANLYYYTPYQPNSAALANEYGHGDTCSAYGNRNFFSYYSDWFGSPTVAVRGVIASYWRSLGGAAGALGGPERAEVSHTVNGGGVHQAFRNAQVYVVGGRAVHLMNDSLNYRHWAQYGGQSGALGWPVTSENCARDGSSCTVTFTGGVLGWTPATGVHSIVGTRASEYLAQGGPGSRIGHPTGPAEWVAANGGGWVQRFSGGRVHAAGNGAGFWFNPDSLIGREYDRLGAGAGALGWPTGLEQCRVDGCFAEFQNGVITWSSTRGVQTFSGETGAAYLRGGGPRGELGLPIAAQNAVSGGTVLSLRGGTLYARNGASAYFATAASLVHARYLSLGGATGSLGWPISDENCASAICETRYQSGSIVWTRDSGAVAVLGTLDERYREAGGPRGKLGPPVAEARVSASNGGGRVQTFRNGIATATNQGSAYAFSDSLIHQHWAYWGSEAGQLGWPLGSERCGGGRCSTSYSGGLLGWTAASGVHSITGERFRSYSAYGGVDGALGVPVGATIFSSASGGGSTQRFQGGVAYSSAGSTYFANGDSLIHARYEQLGGPGSRLGWPTSNEVCANGTCTSRYQGGTLTWTAAGGVRG